MMKIELSCIKEEVLNSNSEIINKYDNIFIDYPPSLNIDNNGFSFC